MKKQANVVEVLQILQRGTPRVAKDFFSSRDRALNRVSHSSAELLERLQLVMKPLASPWNWGAPLMLVVSWEMTQSVYLGILKNSFKESYSGIIRSQDCDLLECNRIFYVT